MPSATRPWAPASLWRRPFPSLQSRFWQGTLASSRTILTLCGDNTSQLFGPSLVSLFTRSRPWVETGNVCPLSFGGNARDDPQLRPPREWLTRQRIWRPDIDAPVFAGTSGSSATTSVRSLLRRPYWWNSCDLQQIIQCSFEHSWTARHSAFWVLQNAGGAHILLEESRRVVCVGG